MSSTTSKSVADPQLLSSSSSLSRCESDERNLAYVVYGLLFISPFSLGLTALVGAVLAYIKKQDCTSYIQTHFRFQIKSFWIVFALWAISNSIIVICTVVFLATFMNVVLADNDITDWQTFIQDLSQVDTSQIPVSTTLAVASGYVVSAILTVVATVWILIASISGVVRLNQHKSIGKRLQTA